MSICSSRWTKTSLVFAFLAGFLSACTGPEDSRNVASQTASSLSVYETQVKTKIAAEKRFYSRGQAALFEYLSGRVCSTPSDACKPREAPKTLLYTRIVNNANSEARMAAESIVYAANPRLMSVTMDFVRKGLSDDLEFHRSVVERRVQLRENLLKELARLEIQSNQLKKVKQSLDKLSKESNGLPDPEIIKSFSEVIKEAVEKRSGGS